MTRRALSARWHDTEEFLDAIKAESLPEIASTRVTIPKAAEVLCTRRVAVERAIDRGILPALCGTVLTSDLQRVIALVRKHRREP